MPSYSAMKIIETKSPEIQKGCAMSTLNLHPEDCKLIINFFYCDEEQLEEALTHLEGIYGPIDLRMEPIDFNHTNYYAEEMGKTLKKMMVSFRDLVGRESLVVAKHEAVKLEHMMSIRYAQSNNRVINIDPGHLLPEKFVLSTGKNFPHRIYLDKGVYADLTLIYRHNRFESLPWTYSDYLEVPAIRFLADARLILVEQLREIRAEREALKE